MILGFAFAATVPDLLKTSAFVAVGEPSWYDHYEDIPHYRWIDDRRFVLWKRPEQEWRNFTLTAFDTESHLSYPLRGLTKAMQDAGADPDFELSPNGKEVLAFGAFKKGSIWAVMDLAGRVEGSWPRYDVVLAMSSVGPTSYAHWSKDGTFVTESELFWEQGKKPRPFAKIWTRSRLALQRETARPRVFGVPIDLVEADAWDIGGGRTFYIHNPSDGSQPDYRDLISWNMAHPGKPVWHRVEFPHPNQAADYCLSPDRSRIAWTCFRYKNPKWRTAKTPQLFKEISLWTCRIDGSRLRKVGAMKCVNGDGEGLNLKFGELQWLPSGKALSFMYRRKLYRLPVPAG